MRLCRQQPTRVRGLLMYVCTAVSVKALYNSVARATYAYRLPKAAFVGRACKKHAMRAIFAARFIALFEVQIFTFLLQLFVLLLVFLLSFMRRQPH